MLDGKVFQGRILHIISGLNLFSGISKNIEKSNFSKFKKIRINFQYKNMSNHKSWFLLFIPENTIFNSIFSKFGNDANLISNTNHLKINTGKQIISEGRLQNEAFLILKKEGINLNAFNPFQMLYRSSKIILIKNLSIYSKKEIDFLLLNSGDIKKYVVLRFTSLIIIEFNKKKNANLAFKILKKFEYTNKNVTIQWAPLNCFGTIRNRDQLNNQTDFKNTIHFFPWFKKEEVKLKCIEKIFFPLNENPCKKYKILIRNLPFTTKSKDLKDIFKYFNKITSIRVPKKRNGQNRGFGFVEFSMLDQAKKAFILIQNVHIEKRHLTCTILN